MVWTVEGALTEESGELWCGPLLEPVAEGMGVVYFFVRFQMLLAGLLPSLCWIVVQWSYSLRYICCWEALRVFSRLGRSRCVSSRGLGGSW